jgi:hypothetical protein
VAPSAEELLEPTSPLDAPAAEASVEPSAEELLEPTASLDDAAEPSAEEHVVPTSFLDALTSADAGPSHHVA